MLTAVCGCCCCAAVSCVNEEMRLFGCPGTPKGSGLLRPLDHCVKNNQDGVCCQAAGCRLQAANKSVEFMPDHVVAVKAPAEHRHQPGARESGMQQARPGRLDAQAGAAGAGCPAGLPSPVPAPDRGLHSTTAITGAQKKWHVRSSSCTRLPAAPSSHGHVQAIHASIQESSCTIKLAVQPSWQRGLHLAGVLSCWWCDGACWEHVHGQALLLQPALAGRRLDWHPAGVAACCSAEARGVLPHPGPCTPAEYPDCMLAARQLSAGHWQPLARGWHIWLGEADVANENATCRV